MCKRLQEFIKSLFKHVISCKFVFFFCMYYKYVETSDFIKKENLLGEKRLKNKLNTERNETFLRQTFVLFIQSSQRVLHL